MKQYKNILIVLGCGPKKDGKPSDIMVSRAKKTAQLFKKNKYGKVIFSGGPSRGVPESELLRVLLINHVPQRKIITERNSLSTVQNAVFCWEILKDKKPKHITIVTSKYHMPRTKYIFRKLYRHMKVSLKFEAAPDRFDLFQWLYYHGKEIVATIKLRMYGIK